jgi:hypothetical protein
MKPGAHIGPPPGVMTMRRTGALLAIVVAAIFSIAGVAAASTAPIGPNESFIGLVNGHLSKATVEVFCPGPLRVGELGHPLSGQTLGVLPPPPSTVPPVRVGDTGSRGHSVVALFVVPLPPAVPPTTVTFTNYGTEPLPTTSLLPCFGSGRVEFSPQPTSKTARSVSVIVTFVPGCINVCPLTSVSGSSRSIIVTQADNGHSYRLHRGDHLDVELTGPSIYTWSEPTSSNQAVLKRLSGSSGSSAGAVFLAVGEGKAMVTAVGNPRCYPQCEIASLLFEVKITVSGR